MEKKQRNIIVTAVLIIVFIFALSNAFKSIKGKSAKLKPVSKQMVSAQAEVLAKEKQDIKTAEALVWVRDPFSGKIYRDREAGQNILKLDGIMWDEKQPLAMISGHIVKPGDQIDENTVVAIKKDRVILNDGSSNIELLLGY
jgi:biotin carboxyl carrier protein